MTSFFVICGSLLSLAVIISIIAWPKDNSF
jgi:hypothetical protein